MEEKVFNIEEAAGILRCSKRTVYRLIAEGWLKGPNGRPQKGKMGQVSEISLFQYPFIVRLSDVPKRVLRDIRKGRKRFGEIFCQTANANRFSIDEKKCETQPPASSVPPDTTDPSPYPLPQGEGKQRRLHHEFAERHQFSFGWRARQLAPDDPAMQDDLVQEMSLAVLDHKRPATFEFLFELAGNRAIDYLRYEAARGTMTLSQARLASDSFAEKTSGLNAFIEELMQRGVPAKWIEEVIDGRLDVA